MRYSNAAARDHLTNLAARHGVALTWVRSWRDAESWGEARQAVVPIIARPRDLLVGLHELGHVLSPQSRRLGWRFDPGGELACEAWAWAWATGHCPFDIPWRDWQLVGDCLVSYMRSHHRRPAPDPSS